MAAEVTSYLSAVKWSEGCYHINDYVHKCQMPQIAKIVKGQYMSLGVPSFSSPSLTQVAFFTDRGKRVKVIAQCVRFKESRTNNGLHNRVVPIGPKMAIPNNYHGWFEILSEDGRAVRCIESVAELAKRSPHTCLVRENIKVLLAKHDDHNSVSDKVKTLPSGETITLIDTDITSFTTTTKSISNGAPKYLRCVTSKGDTIYLNMEQKGKFSPVAKEDNISGVHTIKNLLLKRLPLMVRLVHGRSPSGLKNFHSDMRLFGLFEDEYVVAVPLLKDAQSLLEVPINAPLKLVTPKNSDDLCQLKEYETLIERCKNMTNDVSDDIQILDTPTPNKEHKGTFKLQNGTFDKDHQQGHQHDHKRRLQSNFLVKRSLSDPQQINSQINSREDLKRGASIDDNIKFEINEHLSNQCAKEDNNHMNPSDKFYDEIDQIYDYVRGFAPLPERIKSDFDAKLIDSNDENKPDPPPLETIPSFQTRRMSYPTIIKDITSPKLTVNDKRGNRLFARNHIYDKSINNSEVKMTYFPNVKVPIRSNSTGKIYLPTPTQSNQMELKNGPKLFVKSSSGQRITSRANKILKYAKNVANPIRNENNNNNNKASQIIYENDPKVKESAANNKTYKSNRSLTTSPIFNIRYKSLTNLHFIAPSTPTFDFNNTLESSNSGQTSSGSGGSKEVYRDPKSKFPKLSRSLTNLFWDITGISLDNSDKINNELNRRKNSHKLLNLDFFNAFDTSHHQLKEQESKAKVGTLYL